MTDSISTFPQTSGGVAIYPTFANFPSSASDGAQGLAADTSYLYVYDTTLGWQIIASPGSAGEIALTSAHLLVGNSSNIAQDRALSGDVSVTNAGVSTVSNASVIAKVLTGYTSGAGAVAATDTILQAIQKLNGNNALKLTNPMDAIGQIITGGVAGAATKTTGLNLVAGNDGTAGAAAGYISQILSVQNSNTATTGSQATIASVTLTVGTWDVSACVNDDAGIVTGGWDAYLYAKGANTGVYAYDHLQYRPGTVVSGAPVNSGTFHSRNVLVVTGDADKTIVLKAQTSVGNTTMYGSINARRCA